LGGTATKTKTAGIVAPQSIQLPVRNFYGFSLPFRKGGCGDREVAVGTPGLHGKVLSVLNTEPPSKTITVPHSLQSPESL